MPEDRRMTMAQFLGILEGEIDAAGVFCIQKQNSNMLEEFREIAPDIELEIPFASLALDKRPDAVNFWMGDARAITSLHKDHYENIYCVVSGYKDFILLPPTDLPWIPYGEFPAARFKETRPGDFKIIEEPDSMQVPWVPVDALDPDLEQHPHYARAQPIHVRVNAGQALYLPSLWFHHVRQSHGCIAVNFWYDMEYDMKYNYFKWVEALVTKAKHIGTPKRRSRNE